MQKILTEWRKYLAREQEPVDEIAIILQEGWLSQWRAAKKARRTWPGSRPELEKAAKALKVSGGGNVKVNVGWGPLDFLFTSKGAPRGHFLWRRLHPHHEEAQLMMRFARKFGPAHAGLFRALYAVRFAISIWAFYAVLKELCSYEVTKEKCDMVTRAFNNLMEGDPDTIDNEVVAKTLYRVAQRGDSAEIKNTLDGIEQLLKRAQKLQASGAVRPNDDGSCPDGTRWDFKRRVCTIY